MIDYFKKYLMDGKTWIALVGLLMSAFGFMDCGMLCANPTVFPEQGGAVGIDETTTVTRTHEDSPRLLLDEIDPRVAKIRPYDVVLDTISRHVSDTRTLTSQTVRHYGIDVIENTATVTTAIAGGVNKQEELITSDDNIIACDQTLLIEGVNGYKEDGVTVDLESTLQLLVIGRSATNHPLVVAVNGQKVGANIVVPAIPLGAKVVCAARAGSETQMQTDPYSGVPTDVKQYAQKMMTQVEESTLHKIQEKEVDWTFSDQEQEAIYDMRRKANTTFWRGEMGVIKEKNKWTSKPEEIYFTRGIWRQAKKEFNFNGNPVDQNNIVSLMKVAFTGNASSKNKILILGSDLLEKFEQIDYDKITYVGERKTKYGLEFTQIISKFGTLNVIHDQSFDDMGWGDRGFILDPDFLTKWTYGWKVNEIDKKKSGQADVEARSLVEICCLTLKQPKSHVRVLSV